MALGLMVDGASILRAEDRFWFEKGGPKTSPNIIQPDSLQLNRHSIEGGNEIAYERE